MKQKISLVYYIAAAKGKQVSYGKAERIANKFTYEELVRLYKLSFLNRGDL